LLATVADDAILNAQRESGGPCVKLTDGEKLILVMLSDISKRLEGQPEIDPNFVTETIYSDQLWGFRWKFSGIPFEKVESPPLVKETVDILDMFMLSISHFQRKSAKDQTKIKEALGYAAHGLEAFPGFDGNNDDHYGVAQYLVEHLDRFTNLPGATNNSHTQSSLPRYRAMLRIYLPLRPKLGDDTFSIEDFISVFAAK
jgi:hypothetical protein